MDKIVVLDFGSQYNQLIVRRLRDLGVYSELLDHNVSLSELKKPEIKGIILSGGPNSVEDEEHFTIDQEVFNLNKPVLGICYGMQLMSKLLGGQVNQGTVGEYGSTQMTLVNSSPLTKGLSTNQLVWMSHGDSVTTLPTNFEVIGQSDLTPLAMIQHLERPLFGTQFHLEVNHTENGQVMLQNFIDVCGCERNWNMTTFIEQEIKKIRDTVQQDHVICGLSGGVDSSVVAALLHEAIGDQLHCIFVDHGCMRKDEAKQVKEMFGDHFHINLTIVDAADRFLDKLKGVSDPEAKRKIIGNEFVYVFDDEALKIEDAKWLAQGTLYTDVIESGTKTAQTIKSHHNVGGLPDDMSFKLIEPLNTLFKDEVRELGRVLGLPDELVDRQPFPGPGLAIRIIGDVTKEKIKIVQESDVILHEEFKKHGLNREIWQYFTVLTPIQSVGVMGDQRTYDYTLAIRAVTSIDGMTADFAHVPFPVLSSISTRIVNEVKGINRVVYDITSKPPGTIEWE